MIRPIKRLVGRRASEKKTYRFYALKRETTTPTWERERVPIYDGIGDDGFDHDSGLALTTHFDTRVLAWNWSIWEAGVCVCKDFAVTEHDARVAAHEALNSGAVDAIRRRKKLAKVEW